MSSTKAIAVVTAVLALGGCATTRPDPAAVAAHWQGLTILGPLEAGLLYHQRAGTPADPRLAFAWGDVCGELDRTAREEALALAQARVAEADGALAAKAAWKVPLRQTLGSYDLQKGGFTTPLKKGAVIRFDRSDFCRQELLFLVAFRNGDDWSVLPVPEDEAKQFVRGNPARTVLHEIEIVPVGWQPGPPGPTLLVDVVRLRTRDAQSERVIYESTLAGRH